MKYKHTVGYLSAIIDVRETETNPTLVPLDEHQYIKDPMCEHFGLRKIVADKLSQAASRLPHGYRFKIFETYRSRDKQTLFWKKELTKLKQLHPDWSESQLKEEANNGIANPDGIGSGHQTGAALDLTICKDGKELDMGTAYLDTSNPQTPTFVQGLSARQFHNRQMLYSLMYFVGLANYPLEWWHYSYGEHEWAVITGHKQTLFAKMDGRVRE